MTDMLNMKNLAMVFLFLVMLSALFITVFDMVTNTPVPSLVATVLGSGIGYCLTILGLNHGVDTINGSIRDTVKGAVTGALIANTKQSDQVNI